MPKMKNNRKTTKRFTATGSGKIRRSKAFSSHILTILRGMIDSLTDPTKEAEMFLNDMDIRRKDAKGGLW